MMATVAVAQVNTNAPAPAPNIVTPPPHHTKAAVKTKAKTPASKAAAKTAPAHVTKVSAPANPLTPGLATVEADNVNYRGQAGLKGEALGQFHKGEVVTVLSAITLDKHAADEPAHWAKIVLPAGTKVWVHKQFVNATDKKVAVNKLNLRAGPGENFSVLGTIEKGAAITEISSKGEWIEVAAPKDAYAFVSANYLRQGEAPAPVVPPPFNPGPGPAVAGAVGPATQIPAGAETPVTVPTPVAEPEKIAAPTTTEPVPSSNPTPPTPPTPVKLAVVAPPVLVDTNLPPPPPRIVTHEGWVRDSVSIVAPTYLELYDPATGKAIDYLYSTTPLLSVARYKGMHVAVEGEEALDSRWKDTPVLTIKKIFVLSTNTPAAK